MLVVKLILLNALFILGFLFCLPEHPWLFTTICLLVTSLLFYVLRQTNKHYQQTFNSLEQGLRNLQDGDFAISLSLPKQNSNKGHQQLLTLFNQVTEKLRDEKQSLYQRELLLDKVVNASDAVTVLVNQRDTIIFANRAAKQFLSTTSLLGDKLSAILNNKMPALLEYQEQNNAIIQLTATENSNQSKANNLKEDIEQSWHLSRHQLRLHGAPHQLILLKPITKELHKQELQTWKKVIRVINHELNNSIAPISSMCHSGTILADRINEPQLDRVFNTISGRINRLSEFIQNYSQLARLSTPICSPVNIVEVFAQLNNLYQFELNSAEAEVKINADTSQMEQLLINLLKNANEHCPDKQAQVLIEQRDEVVRITIRDFGPGMDSITMQKAFLPYYSTKTNGSGIGLSICRDIVEGHHGQVTLSNHNNGGLQVVVQLPLNINV